LRAGGDFSTPSDCATNTGIKKQGKYFAEHGSATAAKVGASHIYRLKRAANFTSVSVHGDFINGVMHHKRNACFT
jgi:hypothetical protein